MLFYTFRYRDVAVARTATLERVQPLASGNPSVKSGPDKLHMMMAFPTPFPTLSRPLSPCLTVSGLAFLASCLWP